MEKEEAMKYDFCGWATKNDIKCSDGRVIRKNAFKHNDGKRVPLVWNHDHNSPDNIIGHALLENREEGVYVYGKFNDTAAGNNAKALVEHGDITNLSIFANRLKQDGCNVKHGEIREVSLVLAGANPGAHIMNVSVAHSDDGEDEYEALVYTEERIDLDLEHAACGSANKKKKKSLEHAGEPEDDEETLQDVLDTLTDKQIDAVAALVGAAMEHSDFNDSNNIENDYEGNDSMKHNVFEGKDQNDNKDTLTHDEMQAIFKDGKRYGSLRESFLAHAGDYGIENIGILFPEATNLNTPPEFIKRETGWVSKVLPATKKTPFSRVRSTFADITADEARAKGYMKGKLKKEEVFTLLKRTTDPQTIYKKQKLDRDDIIDITDFNVVAWIKSEMRIMLDEEIARAILIGDGRLSDAEDKIKEANIRPIYNDADLYTIKVTTTATKDSDADAKAKDFIKTVIKSRKEYKGSGNPTLFTTEDVVTDCLLLEDNIGRRLYESVASLATTLRVKEIVTVPVMEGMKGAKAGGDLLGIIVNLQDYNVGADKGGEVNMFDDFDIDYNQYKYLMETRCSGALIKPYSAIAIETSI